MICYEKHLRRLFWCHMVNKGNFCVVMMSFLQLGRPLQPQSCASFRSVCLCRL